MENRNTKKKMIKLINAMDTMLAVQSKINLGDESGSSGVGIINE